MENTNVTNTTNVSKSQPVEIWQEFTNILSRIKIDEGDGTTNMQYYDGLKFLKWALNQYITYCFESVSHRKLSPENTILYSSVAFNKAFNEFFLSLDSVANIINVTVQEGDAIFTDPEKHDLNVIDSHIYDIYRKMYDILAESMNINAGVLSNIAISAANVEKYNIKYYGDSSLYKELRIYDDFENRVFDRCPEVNVVDKLIAYLMSTSAKSKVEKYCSDFYIEARIAMQGILEHTIFKDEKYSHIASYIKDIADNSIDFSVTQCRQIIDEIYKIVEEKMCCTSAGEIKDICCEFE